MKLYIDSFNDYSPWAGAVDTFERIEREGLLDELEYLLDELYEDGLSITQLNDLLWFESDFIFKSLGITDENEDEYENENN